MSLKENMISILTEIVSNGNDDHKNGATRIYSKLLSELKEHKEDEFFVKYPEIQIELNHLMNECNVSASTKKHKIIKIEDMLYENLKPRFVKEQQRDPNMTMEKHIQVWLFQNANLDFEIDFTIISAGFLAMFQV